MGKNLYENFAETGASAIFPISEKILNLADHTSNMENEAKEEEAKDKEIKAEIVRKTSLKKRMGMTGMASTPTSGSTTASGEGPGTGAGPGAGAGGKKDAAGASGGHGGNGGSRAGAAVAERQLSGVAEEDGDEVLATEGDERVRTQGVDMETRGRASKFIPMPKFKSNSSSPFVPGWLGTRECAECRIGRQEKQSANHGV